MGNMGNSFYENKSQNLIVNQLKKEIFDLQNSIIKYISNYYPKTNLVDYKNDIINQINSAFKKKIMDLDRILNFKFKTDNGLGQNAEKIKEEHQQIKDAPLTYQKKNKIKKYDYFDRKDIQEMNLAITREFETVWPDYNNDEDEIENKSIAFFLLDIANLSRMSVNRSNKFLEHVYSKYKEKMQKNDNNETITITTSDQFKKDFSSWVKHNFEQVKNYLTDYLHSYKNDTNSSYINEKKDNELKKYFEKLYKDLIILYFCCELSIPKVDISFDIGKANNFEGKKMIDILNKGNNRKVNFVYFPSLYSNGNYIENGRQWAFTYISSQNRKTFYFDNLNLDNIIIKNNTFSIPKLSDKLKLKIKSILVPKLNYNISDKIQKEYIFHLKKKNDNKIIDVVGKESNGKINVDENLEFISCDFILMGEKILSAKNIN